MAITTTIPTNLDFPNRGVLERDAFVLAQETAQDLLAGGYTTALNQYAVELNATQTDINTKAEQVANQAVDGGYSQTYINTTFTPKILNTQTDKATPVDADLIPLSDSASSFGLKKLRWLNIKATLKTYFDTLYMALTGNQTIDGVKTFSTSPIVPTPTTGTQAANKDYADTKVSRPELITITGSATFSGTTQNINLTNIGNITLAIGDVIEVSGTTSNNKLFTVESITDNNNIVVNYEHRGTSIPIPSKRLINESASNCTINLYNRAKNAPIGQGQGWCIPASGRTLNTNYTNNTKRELKLFAWGNVGGATLTIENLTSTLDDLQGSTYISICVENDSVYKLNGGANYSAWWEKR